ncbi:MAG: antibiotic biosynthesis monooxygenase [Deltaproteobacteria bacterium]|nr:antibiotic biosynthesis monooxygenase [Deltaproteobacteria bacterium]
MIFGLFGKMTAIDGKREALAANLLRAAELMADVPGCLVYVVSNSLTDPNVIHVTEIWKDEKSHGASLSMPGVRDLIRETMPLLACQPEGTRFAPLGGKGLPG